MKPRRLQSATILSMVTTSAGIGDTLEEVAPDQRLPPGRSYTGRPHAYLRVPLREGPPLRRHAEHERRPDRVLRGLRRARREGPPRARGSLQGVRLLHHRLRQEEGGRRRLEEGQGRVERLVGRLGLLVLLVVVGLKLRQGLVSRQEDGVEVRLLVEVRLSPRSVTSRAARPRLARARPAGPACSRRPRSPGTRAAGRARASRGRAAREVTDRG